MALDFEFSPEQKMIEEIVLRWATTWLEPQMEELYEKDRMPPDLFRELGKIGVNGIVFEEKYGGAGLGYVETLLVYETIARVSNALSMSVGASQTLCFDNFRRNATEKQKMEILPRACSGEYIGCLGITEPNAGSDAGASKTNARLENGQWVVNGSKIFITNSTSKMAGICTVQAITGSKGQKVGPYGTIETKEVSCILVPNGTPGFTTKKMTKKMMWRSSDTGELYFDDCRVPEENLLGKRGEGFHQMLQTLDNGRLAIAAMGLGGAQGAYELAMKYAKERKQFGKPISTFQVNAFKLADMATEIEAARNLLYKACYLKDQGKSFGKEAAMAKLYCSEVMGRVTNEALQIHGGYGLMKEYNIERFFRDYKLLTIGEGTSEVQRIVISRRIGCYETD